VKSSGQLFLGEALNSRSPEFLIKIIVQLHLPKDMIPEFN